MIKIIAGIKARPAQGGAQFQKLSLVPASGRLRIDTEDTEAGPQKKYTLTARLYQTDSQELLTDDLELMLEFTDNTSLFIGTKDIPVRLRISDGDARDITAEHIVGYL